MNKIMYALALVGLVGFACCAKKNCEKKHADKKCCTKHDRGSMKHKHRDNEKKMCPCCGCSMDKCTCTCQK